MASIKVVKCDLGHFHPVRESVIEHAQRNQFGVVFPQQAGTAILIAEWLYSSQNGSYTLM